MRNRMYWGLAILIILLIGVGCVLFMQRTDTKPTEQILKAPPEGETFATGHWDGDKWHRTVPKNPETILMDGEEFQKKHGRKRRIDNLLAIGKRVIEEYPYSDIVLSTRRYHAPKDENGKMLWDKEKMKYLSVSSPLLFDLAILADAKFPIELIAAGKESLKYVDLYPSDSWYSVWKSHTTQTIQGFPTTQTCLDVGNQYIQGFQEFAVRLAQYYYDIHIVSVLVSIEVPPPLNCSDLFVIPPGYNTLKIQRRTPFVDPLPFPFLECYLD